MGIIVLIFAFIGLFDKKTRKETVENWFSGSFWFVLVLGILAGIFIYWMLTGTHTHGQFCEHPDGPTQDFIMEMICHEK